MYTSRASGAQTRKVAPPGARFAPKGVLEVTFSWDVGIDVACEAEECMDHLSHLRGRGRARRRACGRPAVGPFALSNRHRPKKPQRACDSACSNAGFARGRLPGASEAPMQTTGMSRKPA